MITYPIVKIILSSQIIEFANLDVIEANMIQEVSPVSTELPISEAKIRIRTTDPRFQPFSEGAFYNELSNNTEIDVYEYYDDETPEFEPITRLLGHFYLKDWKNPKEGEFEFICQDAIGVLDTLQFDGIFWETNTTLGEAVALLLDPTNIAYSIEEAIINREFRGYLSAGTIREALKQVLFISRAFAMTALSNQIVIRDAILPVPGINDLPAIYSQVYYGALFYGDTEYDGEIPMNEQVMGQKIELKPLVTEIQLVSHDFTKGAVQEEIYSSYLEPGDYKIVYSKPYYNVTAEGAGAVPAYLMTEDLRAITTEDGRILYFPGGFVYGVNYIYLNVIQAGNVVVRGYPYIDSTQVFIYNESEATKDFSHGVRYGEEEYGQTVYAKFWMVTAAPNIWKVSDAMLVTADSAPGILDNIVKFAKLRYLQNTTLFPLMELLPGDIAKVESLYNKFINGIITKIDRDLSKGLLAKTELVGVERKEI
jgi:hypothetical protein